MPKPPSYGQLSAGVAKAIVASVEPKSPAERAGLAPGDEIVTVDGSPLRDVIDWRWETDALATRLEIRHGSDLDTVLLDRNRDESWGVSFTDVVFDGVRTCENHCAFCFMSQLPRGLRRALYVRDDDYRLSFLQGNFVTLTNVTPHEVDRIVEKHLSPLHVSVHAVSPEVRARLVCAREDRALSVLDELLAEGIEVHAQVVLVPGVNDGAELERTLRWLASREGVSSVGVVPLGYTRHQSRYTTSYESVDSATALLDQLTPWREAFRERDGVSWVHAADEFYLVAGREAPPAEEYDAYPQYENGIGMLRTFVDDLADLAKTYAQEAKLPPSGEAPLVVTGTLFAPTLQRLLNEMGMGESARIIAVENRFFGGNVSVAGLLTATDIIDALDFVSSGERCLLPEVLFNSDGLTLDDRTVEQISGATGCRIEVVGADARGLLSAML